MDQTGYTADQCIAMRDKLPNLVEKVKNGQISEHPNRVHDLVSTILSNKVGTANFAHDAFASSAKSCTRVCSWLLESESERSSASYEAESEDSFESLPSRERSRDRRHHSHREYPSRHGRSDSNYHRRPISRQSSHTRRGSVDTRYHRSSRSGKPKKSWSRKMLDSFRSRGRSVRFSE